MKKLSVILFFGMVTMILSCGQKDPNKQIDEGTVADNIYTSKEIGWQITIPEGWKVISRERQEIFDKKGVEMMEGVLGEGVVDTDTGEFKNLIGFQKNRFNLFQSTSEPFEEEYEGQWEENNKLMKELIYEAYLQQGIDADSTPTITVNVDGLDFRSYEFTIRSPKGEVILKQRIHNRLVNGYDFSVNINYNNETDKKIMVDAWLNSTFAK
ncbi:hypothetical protein ACJD0Z_17050 [Flavobacteriaceae bacterium M23B6Z8]